MSHPKRINILITGTPGVGKSTLAETLAERTGMNYVNIGKLVKEKELYNEVDEEFDALVLDEDKVVDELESQMIDGFNVVEHHSCDFFPERWFQLVIVLRTNTNVLYDRLALPVRGYSQKKIDENMECEIMQVCLDEAKESYTNVVELPSNSMEDFESNIARLITWVEQNKDK